MEILNNQTGKFIKPLFNAKTRKNTVYDEFLEILNPSRMQKGLPPISYSRLGKLLQHLDSWDKSIFLASCKEKENPSAFFWWSLKIKK